MEPSRRVQIHQYNDPEILEFLNDHRVQYRLLGDHLFVVRCRGRDVAAGPGDWLTTTPVGEVEVRHGDYARRAQLAIDSTRRGRATLPKRPARRSPLAARRAARLLDRSADEPSTGVPESETDQWKRAVEAEARERLKRSIQHIAQSR
jgi:hypothetical protein